MIPNTKHRKVASSGVTESGVFGISLKDTAHIMGILRDTLYSDKVMAVLREYSSNAWDAHRSVGKHDVPIKVTLPTTMNPTLSIRDYGPGLSPNDVFEVYTQYGASTKRDTDDAVGMLGIGSKSGFAYSDSFTVTSWHGGKKRAYVAVLDESEKGVMNLLFEEDCGTETGVEIQIAVRPEDVWEFDEKAKKLFHYFVPRPEINIEIPPLPPERTALKNGIIFDHPQSRGEWIAVMGCVPYRINLDQLQNQGRDGGLGEYLHRVSGALYFNIGEVHINASREELKYTKVTKQAVVDKFHALIEEFVNHTIDTIRNSNFTAWEKRLRAQILRILRLPVPKPFKELASDHAVIKTSPAFSIAQGHHLTSTIQVSESTRLLLRDDERNLVGFDLTGRDYLVRANDGVTWEEVEKELKSVIEESELTGITVGKLSTMTWRNPAKPRRPKRPPNRKHHVRSFLLKTDVRFAHPWSEIWEVVKRTPTPDDVFVILQGFKTKGYDIYDLYLEDRKLAGIFGVTLPPVYGYKYTEKKPILNTDCVGKPYLTWRKEFAISLITPHVMKLIDTWCWSQVVEEWKWRYQSDKHIDTLTEHLGENHAIVTTVRRHYEAKKETLKSRDKLFEGAIMLTRRLKLQESSAANAAMKAIYQKYPLFSVPRVDLEELWGESADKWIEYVKLIDSTTRDTTEEAEEEEAA